MAQTDYRQLLSDLLIEFREAEIKKLCSNLNLVYEKLEGKDRGERAHHLIRLLAQAGRLSDLVDAMVTLRPDLSPYYDDVPDLNWLDKVAIGESVPADELPTQKWDQRDSVGPEYELQVDQLTPRATAEEGPTQTWTDSPKEETVVDRAPGGQREQPRSRKLRSEPLVGRQRELSELAHRLLKGGSCAVSGGPGIGKTALLRSLCFGQAFPSGSRVLVAYLDAADPKLDSPAAVHDAALVQWYGDLSDAPAPQAASFEDFARQTRTIRSADFRPVLCLDGIDSLLESANWASSAGVSEWSELIADGQVGFVFSAKKTIDLVFKEHGLEPRFARRFFQLRLGLLEKGFAVELLKLQSLPAATALDRRVTDIAVTVCGRHPYYLVLGREVMRTHPHLEVLENREIRALLLKQIVPEWMRVWEGLTDIQREALGTVTHADVPLVIARQRQSLEEYGLIDQKGDAYRYFSEGFAAWIAIQRTNRHQSA